MILPNTTLCVFGFVCWAEITLTLHFEWKALVLDFRLIIIDAEKGDTKDPYIFPGKYSVAMCEAITLRHTEYAHTHT